jgi:glycosyltransferase involved in cell wall biosynthesis
LKISIITVCKNAETSIESTILSVINQTYQNIEYIVIDGNSSDNTVNIINKFKDKLSFFKSEPDVSLYEAMNKGIQQTTGNIIGFLHAGDVFHDYNVILQIAQTFLSNSSVDLLFSDVAYVNNESKLVRYMSPEKWKPTDLKFGLMPPHPGFYCKKSCYDSIGYYKENYQIAADFELLLRFLIKNQLRYTYLPLLTVNMKLGGKSNNGLRSYCIKTKEINYALDSNQLKSNSYFILFRFFNKLSQFIFKHNP